MTHFNKIIQFSLAIIITFSFASFSIASPYPSEDDDEPPTEVAFDYGISPISQQKKVRVVYRTNMDKKVFIKIYNSTGDLIYNDVKKHQSYLKTVYNFQQLPDGIYTIKMRCGDFKAAQTVNIGQVVHSKYSAYLSPSY